MSHQTTDENILLVQSIQITDKFAFNGADPNNGEPRDGLAKLQLELGNKSDTCINGYGKLPVRPALAVVPARPAVFPTISSQIY